MKAAVFAGACLRGGQEVVSGEGFGNGGGLNRRGVFVALLGEGGTISCPRPKEEKGFIVCSFMVFRRPRAFARRRKGQGRLKIICGIRLRLCRPVERAENGCRKAVIMP